MVKCNAVKKIPKEKCYITKRKLEGTDQQITAETLSLVESLIEVLKERNLNSQLAFFKSECLKLLIRN